jgi:hypothetical protein
MSEIDWQRIQELPMDGVVGSAAVRWGEDRDEVRSIAILALAEQAAREDDFLVQTDGYLRQCAKWGISTHLKHYLGQYSRHHVPFFDFPEERLYCLADDGDMPTAGALDARDAIRAVLEAGDEELVGVLRIMLGDPERFAHVHSGRWSINIRNLMQVVGRSSRWCRLRMRRIRQALEIQGVLQ